MTGDLRPYHCNGPLTDDEAMAGTVSTSSGPRVRWRRTWVIAAGLAIAVLVIVGIVVFSGGGSSSTSALADQQLASVQRVCELRELRSDARHQLGEPCLHHHDPLDDPAAARRANDRSDDVGEADYRRSNERPCGAPELPAART